MAKKLENKPFFPNWFQCNSYTKTIHETLVFMRCSGFSVTFCQSSQYNRYILQLQVRNVYTQVQYSEISLLVFWLVHFYKKIYSSGIRLSAVALFRHNAHKVPLCFVSAFFLILFLISFIQILFIHLFDTGSVLPSLSAAHL